MEAIQPYTVFLFIGPHNCGKSTFAKTQLIPRLRERTSDTTNIQYLSSDDIRRDLLGDPVCDKRNIIMLEASKDAFDLLYLKLKKVTKFPINAPFVIIDSTGLSEQFRSKIAEICTENHYHLDLVMFNYQTPDYYKYGGDKSLITKHVTRFKHTIGSLGDFRIHSKIMIRDHAEDLEKLQVSGWVNYQKMYLDPQKAYLVVGDIHTCVDELKELLLKARFTIVDGIVERTSRTSYSEIVLIGDLIDKGSKTEETIEFIYRNLVHPNNLFRLVKGNHESTTFKLLNGIIKEASLDKNIMQYFNSYPILKEREDLREKFFHIYSQMCEFLVYVSPDYKSKSFVATHSPCKMRHLQKLDTKSLEAQMNSHLDREADFEKQFRGLIEIPEGEHANYPYHVFGHFALDKPYMGFREGNNRVGIDTACIEGYRLTGVWLGKNCESPILVQVPFMDKQKKLDRQPNRLTPLQKDVRVEVDLSPNDRRRVDHILQHKINFVSGTISPANKNIAKNVLESLEEGLAYFHKLSIPRVILQTKYMGSRCNVYLDCRDLDASYCVSRNGYLVRKTKEELKERVYIHLYEKLKSFIEQHKIRMIIVDGELMPWNCLGKGLIEDTFINIDLCLQKEQELLQESGFWEAYRDGVTSMKESGYLEKVCNSKKKDLQETYGPARLETYQQLAQLEKRGEMDDPEKDRQLRELYHQQVEIYGKEDTVHLKPFNILKIILESGEEVIPFLLNQTIYLDQHQIFDMLCDDPKEYCVVDLTDFEVALKKADTFFQSLVGDDKEGLVIKPLEYPEKLTHAPYLKVRNSSYLSIIYGYDYLKPATYDSLIKQKSITRKLKNSIADFNAGCQMLAIPYDEIEPGNSKYENILARFIAEEQSVGEIDPRL